MSATVTATASAALRRFLGVVVRPETYLAITYLVLAFPLGFAYVLFVSLGLGLGVGFTILLVGIPILGLTVLGALAAARVEAALARYLLDVDVSQRPLPTEASLADGLKRVALDRGTWKTVAYLPSKLVFGTVALVVATTVLATGASMLLVPLYYTEPGLYVGLVTDRPVELHPSLYVAWNTLLVGFETVVTVDAWRVDTLSDSLLVAAGGGVLCLLGLHAFAVLGRAASWYTEFMLDGAYAPLAAGK